MISRLGRYEVLAELGQGAMGTVYRARDPLIDRVVAIKTINLGAALEEKEGSEERFYQEAKAAGRLSHPNIVTVYDVGKSGNIAYIAMEFLEGRELRDILDDVPVLPASQVLNIVAQVADGLAYAHDHDIVHRDIKPANIMVGRDGHAKITDFGIARVAFSAVRTQTGMVLGSPKYMSPEQVMGKAIDQRSDVFSLGVMLYEMLTGQTPFNGDNVNAITYQILHTIPTPPKTLNAVLPDMLNFIVAKALAKELDDRYQDARDLAKDLRACLAVLPHQNQQLPMAGFPARSNTGSSDGLIISGSMSANDEGGNPAAVAGLSPVFDSAAAAMRLAVLTGSSEDVEALSKTLKTSPESVDQIIQAATAAKALAGTAAQPHFTAPEAISRASGSPALGNYILMIIVLLVLLLSLAVVIIF